MDTKYFLLRRKRELSKNSPDTDERKGPHKTTSFDDSIAKAANNRNCLKKH